MLSNKRRIVSFMVYGIVLMVLGIAIFKTNSLFAVNKKKISNCQYSLSQLSYTYDGKEKKPKVDIKDYLYPGVGSRQSISSSNFTCSYENNINAGTATVVVKGKGNYEGTLKIKFYIHKRDISNGKVTFNKSEYVYSHKLKEPKPTVKVNGSEIKDFNVTYKNNRYVGTATATVTGTGNNTGSIVKTFKIVKRDISKSKVTFNKSEYIYTGKEKKPKPNVELDGVKINDFKVTYKNNKNIGTATATITGINNNKGTVTKTFKIVNENSIIRKARKIKKYMVKHNYDYCLKNGSGCEHSSMGRCGLNDTFEQSKTSYHNTCCATYVSWVLREAGYISKTSHSSWQLINNILIPSGKFKKITNTNDIKKGDIIYYKSGDWGHVEISAGGTKVYSAGCKADINTKGATETRCSRSTINTILRLK